MLHEPHPDELLSIAESHLAKVLEYDPYYSFPDVKTRDEFRILLSKDPAFSPLGLSDDRYIIARIGGNLITSLHRKIGDMYEAFFEYLIKTRFDLSGENFEYRVDVRIGNRVQSRSTDGMIPIEKLKGVNLPKIQRALKKKAGLGFEVRSCYQIGDSKRIQADWDMALALQSKSIVPVMLIFCNTSLRSPVTRLRKKWRLFEGNDTFAFIKDLTGFDLFAFMNEHSHFFAETIGKIFAKL